MLLQLGVLRDFALDGSGGCAAEATRKKIRGMTLSLARHNGLRFYASAILQVFKGRTLNAETFVHSTAFHAFHGTFDVPQQRHTCALTGQRRALSHRHSPSHRFDIVVFEQLREESAKRVGHMTVAAPS